MAFENPINQETIDAKILAAQNRANEAWNYADTANTAAGNAQTAAGNAQTAANNADSKAQTALNTANGKNKITHSANTPSGGGTAGDTWFRYDANAQIIGQWRYSGSAWVAQTINNALIANLDAGKITVGTLTGIAIQSVTMTAAIFRTAASGKRMVIDPANQSVITFYSGLTLETTAAQIYESSDSGTTPTGDPTRRNTLAFNTADFGAGLAALQLVSGYLNAGPMVTSVPYILATADEIHLDGKIRMRQTFEFKNGVLMAEGQQWGTQNVSFNSSGEGYVSASFAAMPLFFAAHPTGLNPNIRLVPLRGQSSGTQLWFRGYSEVDNTTIAGQTREITWFATR